MEPLKSQSNLSRSLTDEIARLHSKGFSLLPLDGKRPLAKNWSQKRLSLSQVLGPLHRVPSHCYGIRLGGVAVFDFDEDDPRLVAEIEKRFGPSSVHVKSPRGCHLYFASPTRVQINLRASGLPVDIKSGPSSYVVGPYSIRPDSGEYLPIKGQLGMPLSALRLPEMDKAKGIFCSPERVPAAPPIVTEGNRHRELISGAIRVVENVDSPAELAEILTHFRDTQFEHPKNVSDREVKDVAEWV